MPFPHALRVNGSCIKLIDTCKYRNLRRNSSIRRVGGKMHMKNSYFLMRYLIYIKIWGDSLFELSDFIPPPVCGCWTGSQTPSSHPLPSRQHSPTALCWLHLQEHRSWLCSRRDRCPIGEKTSERSAWNVHKNSTTLNTHFVIYVRMI